MTESVQQAVERQTRPVDPAISGPAAEGGWQTPDYTVVETALEVTAYSLSKR
ncbi:pyrroloquinoline quinone precursor peptide PqqA [Streptomyces sp. 71268]|uniref:pyrroloquinoline quinone precursor peptide PqqA n=1 Tax=Streptomyces sp. 71268 TaxID=3002640 RepID=UPI0023F79BB5|nr:pyrroloquinoline quinone precursor peptide PqqA [Streptomyces sp. 71268]WEV24334.1 pyrroloquinoline quinone precursor peptide PqqA [Streptomyces sp. 71268]